MLWQKKKDLRDLETGLNNIDKAGHSATTKKLYHSEEGECTTTYQQGNKTILQQKYGNKEDITEKPNG